MDSSQQRAPDCISHNTNVKSKENHFITHPSILYHFLSHTHYKPSSSIHPFIAHSVQASTSSTTTPHSCVSSPYMIPPNHPLSTLA
jgi:hypothetical protein